MSVETRDRALGDVQGTMSALQTHRPRSLRGARLQQILEEACVLAPLSLELIALDGALLAKAGQSEARRAATPLTFPLRAGQDTIAYLKSLSDTPGHQALAAMVAARLADQLVAEDELDSLANEILHTYEMLHVIYDLTATLGRSLDLQALGAAVTERILLPLSAVRATVVLTLDGSVQLLAETQRAIPETEQAWLDAHARALLTIDGASIGSIEVYGKSGGEQFTSADLKLLDSIAVITAGAIQQTRLRRRELALCDQVRAEIARASLELQPLLERVVGSIADTFGYASVSCWMLEERTLVRKACAGQVELPDVVDCAHSPQAERIAQGQSILTSTLQGADEPIRCCVLADMVSSMCVPLSRSGRVIGVLHIVDNAPLSAHDLYLIESIVVQVNIAIDNALLLAEIQRANNELAQTSKLAAVGTLAAGVSHEFNNILTSVQGYAELALRGMVTNYDDALETIMRAARRGTEITRSLLAFARPRPVAREMIDMRYVLSESLRLVEHGLATHGVELVRHHDASVYVNGDITQLMQVVLNLINNARDAMMPGGGELTITLREHEQSAIVEVRDTGCGIPEELLARIFEPFMTTKGALAGSTVSGTGLGLSVSYGIITAHGGELQVESQIGVGSTFRIVLPLAFSKIEREPEVAEEEAPRRPVDRALRLLVVEDEPEVRRFMGTMLEFAGHDVTCVGSGAEALLELAAQPCDVIVSDLMMPAMSGIELIRRLRERGDLTPVILVTGRNDMLPNELDTYDSRMYFIQKPFATEDLFRTLTLAVS